MSKIDYQALREAAEKATWGDWDSYKPHRGARGYEVRLSSQAIAQHVLKTTLNLLLPLIPRLLWHYWMNGKETCNTSNAATRRTRILR
ncbi:ead/Ea22-like family protein [Escherichia coli]|nr:ead/Ea22-like family protein [Escherichia coli]